MLITMKRSLFFNLVLAAALVLGGAVGCKRKPKSPTPIPSRTGQIGDTGRYGAQPPGEIVQPGPVVTPGPTGVDPDGEGPEGMKPVTTDMDGWKVNRDILAAYTVYFDFDRSTIRAGERAKVEEVGRYLLENPGQGVRIEGHCDERGTEGYNLSLGERRALAVREYLLNMGIPDNRVDTISYGEDRPAAIGNTEEAYAKNRRGEFLVLSP